MVLHEGAIAEMRTGEGKTLVATLAVYLNALKGEGVHVVTVNDYLAGARRKITVRQGIEQMAAKKLVAKIKEAKLKVEAQINGDKIRVSGKKRDDLQLAMATLRKADVEVPLQFENFRD